MIEQIRHLTLSAELLMIMAKVDLRLRWVVSRHFSSYVVKFLRSGLEISSAIHELQLSVIWSSQSRLPELRLPQPLAATGSSGVFSDVRAERRPVVW